MEDTEEAHSRVHFLKLTAYLCSPCSESGCHHPGTGLAAVLITPLPAGFDELRKVESVLHTAPVETAPVEIMGFYWCFLLELFKI